MPPSPDSISPTSSIIPVNIGGDHQIRPRRLNRPILQPDRVGQTVGAGAADGGNFASPKQRWRHESDYLINDAGLDGVKSQVRPAFHQEALNLAGIQIARKLF